MALLTLFIFAALFAVAEPEAVAETTSSSTATQGSETTVLDTASSGPTPAPKECNSCVSPSLQCRANATVTCVGAQDVCISVEDWNKLGIELRTGSSKSCAEKAKNVNNSFMFDFGDEGTLKIASKLCDETECQAVFPNLDIQNFYNGKYCPKCYKPGASSCEDNGTVSCVGGNQHCSAISGEISRGDTKIPFAAKGCVSESVNDLSKNKLPVLITSGIFTYNFSKVSFEPANSALATLRRMAFTLDSKDFGPQVAFFFPCFLGIFVVKHIS